MFEIVKCTPKPELTEVARRVDQALAVLRTQRLAHIPPPPPAKVIAMTPDQHARYLELLRICCIRGETYVSRYMHKARGRYDYASSTPIPKAHYRLIYAAGVEAAGVVPSEDIHDETCPYCQASGEPILCMACKNETCWGSVVLNYHRCWCGHEGEMSSKPRQFPGFRPKDWR